MGALAYTEACYLVPVTDLMPHVTKAHLMEIDALRLTEVVRTHCVKWHGGDFSLLEVRAHEKTARHVLATEQGTARFKSAYRPELQQLPGEADQHRKAAEAWHKKHPQIVTPLWPERKVGMAKELGMGYSGWQSALTTQLSALICKVFDNEASFLAEFMPNGIEVEEFYMASERCVVATAFSDRTTIKTADFLAWAEGLDNAKW